MVVVDSSLIIAYHNARDVHHTAAVRAMDELIAGTWGRALLLEYVFLEVVTVLFARRGLPMASTVSSVLLQARELDFVPCSELFLDALEIFRNQVGTKLSFTDAAIVAIARSQDGGVIATFDRDFRNIKGITVIPR
ncbi:MAG: type II toxin-antitoxin system VapC family toxin [Candidatus Binatia bacterium]